MFMAIAILALVVTCLLGFTLLMTGLLAGIAKRTALTAGLIGPFVVYPIIGVCLLSSPHNRYDTTALWIFQAVSILVHFAFGLIYINAAGQGDTSEHTCACQSAPGDQA